MTENLGDAQATEEVVEGSIELEVLKTEEIIFQLCSKTYLSKKVKIPKQSASAFKQFVLGNIED